MWLTEHATATENTNRASPRTQRCYQLSPFIHNPALLSLTPRLPHWVSRRELIVPEDWHSRFVPLPLPHPHTPYSPLSSHLTAAKQVHTPRSLFHLLFLLDWTCSCLRDMGSVYHVNTGPGSKRIHLHSLGKIKMYVTYTFPCPTNGTMLMFKTIAMLNKQNTECQSRQYWI